MRRVALVLTLALLVPSLATLGARAVTVECAPTEGVTGGEWPQFGGDLAGSRNQTAEHLIDQSLAPFLQPAWTFDANKGSVQAGQFGANSEITGSPVVDHGCVFVGTNTGNQQPGWVFALNADTGEIVWRQRLTHGVYSTLAVDAGRVFAFVSRVGQAYQGEPGGPPGEPWGPYLVAFDERTGERLWWHTVDAQVGSDAVSSPVAWDGMVWVGVSGTAAEGDAGDRGAFEGNFAIYDAASGALLKKTYTISKEQRDKGFAGGAIWSTMSIDTESKLGYVGSGNPFSYHQEDARTNAVLQIDLDPAHTQTFGEITGSYKGDVEKYVPPVQDALAPYCADAEDLTVFAGGLECGNLDLDFGAQPNIFRLADGRKVVGVGQKSGVYHVFDAITMQPVWTALLGTPSAVGGIVGSAAVDENGVYGPHTIGGYLWSLGKDATAGDQNTPRWISPVADGVHWGNPVTAANGVLYTVDLKGFLDGYDAQTGLPILHRPIVLGSDTWTNPTFSWGGVTVARESVFATVGVGLTSVGTFPPYPRMPDGFVVAFRPGLPSLPSPG
jgi:polyvinyl alcohol dehydrogenase (cytochrome)